MTSNALTIMFGDMKYVSGSFFVAQTSRSVNLINIFIKAILICFILLIGFIPSGKFVAFLLAQM